jgi:hypothetical protein
MEGSRHEMVEKGRSGEGGTREYWLAGRQAGSSIEVPTKSLVVLNVGQ